MRQRARSDRQPVAAEPRRAAPAPLPALLELQRSAGNQAVLRVLARFVDAPAAETVMRAIQVASVEELRTIVEDLDAANVAGDQVGVRLPLQSHSVRVADATPLRRAASDKLHQRLMERLANDRQPMFVAMQGAANETDRRTRTVALRAFDAPLLADIRRYAPSPARRWQHESSTVQDGVLAAVQLEAVANAEGDLASPAGAHERSWRAAGMAANFDWCGFFVMENYLQSNLDQDLKRGFFHVTNVEHYFTYTYAFGERDVTRVMKWIYAENEWHDLREYHTGRGSLRTWIDAARIFGGGSLDIRAGDVVLIDHSGSGAADHIVMVHSYDMTTNTLFTIGGNDGGYEVDTSAAHAAPAGESAADRANRERLEAATGQPLRPGSRGGHVGVGSHDLSNQPDPVTLRGRQRVRIYGIGRPSIVDLEEHHYDSTNRNRPPAAAPR